MITIRPVTALVDPVPDVREQFDGAHMTRLTLARAEAALRQIEAAAEGIRHCTAQMYEDAEYLLDVQRKIRLCMLAAKM